MTDPYYILNISRDASDQQVKNAYRKLAKRYHPDVSKETNAAEKFIAINEAYETILNGTTQFEQIYETFTPPSHTPPTPDPQARARQYAQAKYEEFVRNNTAFKQKWYYFPTKVFSYAFVYLLYLFGIFMIIVPIGAGVFTSFENGYILPLFLVLFGGLWIKTTKSFEKEIAQYFKEY